MNRILRLLLCALLLPAMLTSCASAETRALFINVRKADAALIEVNGLRFLVDTGHKDSLDHLQQVLETYGVSRVDGIFITHTDKDHVGGLKKLLKSGFEADMLYAPALHSEKSNAKHPVNEASEKYGVPMTWLSSGDVIPAGEGASFTVLGPLRKDPGKENNNSLVMHLVTPDGSLLLTGDMELPEEADLLAAGLIPRADVLKVPNHGEDDATGRQFALTVQPKWAIISTNTIDEPDTPDEKVLRNLTQARASIAVTQDADVGILVILDKGKLDVQAINWE